MAFAVTVSSPWAAGATSEETTAIPTSRMVFRFTCFFPNYKCLKSATRYDLRCMGSQSPPSIAGVLFGQPVIVANDPPGFFGRLDIVDERQVLVANGSFVCQELEVDHFFPI